MRIRPSRKSTVYFSNDRLRNNLPVRSVSIALGIAALLPFVLVTVASYDTSTRNSTIFEPDSNPTIQGTNTSQPSLQNPGMDNNSADTSRSTYTDLNLHLTTQQDPNTNDASLIVNGQDVPIPESGSSTSIVKSDDGTTTKISITSSNSSSGDSKSSSRLRIISKSSSETSTTFNHDETVKETE